MHCKNDIQKQKQNLETNRNTKIVCIEHLMNADINTLEKLNAHLMSGRKNMLN